MREDKYFDQGLGVFIYNDQQPTRAQLGDILSDLENSISAGVNKAVSTAEGGLKNTASSIVPAVQSAAVNSFLNTGTGQAVVADAKQSWLQQQAANVKTVYLNNATAINTGLLIAGGLFVLYVLSSARESGKRAAKREVAPALDIPAAPVAAANPRRRRRKSRRGRK